MFLQEITDRMEKLNPQNFKNVESDGEEKNFVIQEMTDVHRRLYTVAFQYKDEGRQLRATMMQLHAQIINEEPDDKKQAVRAEKELHAITLSIGLCLRKYDAVMGMLWVELHESFDDQIPPEAETLHIVSGNKVGWSRSNKKKLQFPDFLKGMINLCDTCCKSFAECNGNPVFSIDRDPTLRGAAADVVEKCDQHITPTDFKALAADIEYDRLREEGFRSSEQKHIVEEMEERASGRTHKE